MSMPRRHSERRALASLFLLGLGMRTSALPMPSPGEWAFLILLGGVSTAVPTLAFGVASARLPSILTTSLGLMTPLSAALLPGLMLGEWPALLALPGALVTLAGLVAVLRAPPRGSRSA
jgi:drug/metabolite transporter, DME family